MMEYENLDYLVETNNDWYMFWFDKLSVKLKSQTLKYYKHKRNRMDKDEVVESIINEVNNMNSTFKPENIQEIENLFNEF